MGTMLRKATQTDVDRIAALIRESVLGLQAAEYTLEQRQGALGTVFGVDRMLIGDRTYFVDDSGPHGQIIACGGWSKRNTLFGSDNAPGKDDRFLDPAAGDAARIRAFFVHPAFARRGLGSRILEACEREAREAGFRRLELGATLTGIPLYERHGFRRIETVQVPLPNGASISIVRMEKTLSD
jgi:N-acetylglutamate synthase-like GNAT family acetyltransferase